MTGECDGKRTACLVLCLVLSRGCFQRQWERPGCRNDCSPYASVRHLRQDNGGSSIAVAHPWHLDHGPV